MRRKKNINNYFNNLITDSEKCHIWCDIFRYIQCGYNL